MILYLINGILIVALLVAAYCDVRWGKIYNKITFPCMFAGLLLNTLKDQWSGTLLCLEGMGAALLLVLVLGFVVGPGFGGGDVKLLAAIGALRGPEFVLWSALFSAIAGGVLVLILLLRQRIFWYTLRNLFQNTVLRASGSRTEIAEGSLAGKQPYGVAILVGTLLALAHLGMSTR